MAKKTAKDGPDKLRPDVAETAYRTLLEAIGEVPKTVPTGKRQDKNPEAVKRGRKGGKRGGAARAQNLLPTDRSEAASRAARSRWGDQSEE